MYYHIGYSFQTTKKLIGLPSILLVCFVFTISSYAQTSWKGVTSTAWATSSNWTAGVPSSTLDAIIGDANFTGAYQPSITASSSCKNLTFGTKASVLTVSYTFTVYGTLTISSSGTINHGGYTMTVKGDWNNSGNYTGTSTSSSVKFTGTTQSVNGTTATAFRKISTSSTTIVTLNTNISVSVSLSVGGTFIPTETATPYVISGAGTLGVTSTGNLKVTASTFVGNYATTGTITLSSGSTVDYSAATGNQTVRQNLTYSTLTISGGLVKTLAGNLNSMTSSSATRGNINVTAGTLDLSTFTANRGTSVAGGTFTVANGATLRIGGVTTNFFPSNFATYSLSLTSTVEYYAGSTQLVSAKTYGNLIFSSATGAAIKTLPATAFTVAGGFTSTIGAGSSVNYTAAAAITFSGTVNIGISTLFNGGSYSHTVANNWTNNGTYTGATSTVSMNASGGILGGTGTNNFYNLVISASNNSAASGAVINVSGDLSSTGAGALTVASGGAFSMTGTSKSITGSGFVFDNLTVTGSITTASNIIVAGNLSVAGSLNATAGTILLSGSAKTISGAGIIAFSSFAVSGSISVSSGFSISTSLDVSGTLTASAGTATFSGTSTLNGTANLYNVTLNGTSLQLSTNSVLGIANAYNVTAGTLNVTTSTPNTVIYNGAGSQNITGGTYNNLIVTNGNTKTAMAGMTVNGDFTIDAGTTFNSASFTAFILGNWVNNGSFMRGTGTVEFTGSADATVTGATAFNIVNINKTTATNQLSLLSSISAVTINMTNGLVNTGSNTVTITNTRTGSGVILGNIQRTHVFTAGVAYEFESPNNTITFSAVTGVTSVTVNVSIGSVADFPFGGSISRVYNITIPSGTYTAAFRMHYEDAELNGNAEASIQAWYYSGTVWQPAGKSGNNTSLNYVEQTGITNLTGRWTLSDDANLLVWNGSVSSDWSVAGNWTTLQGTPSKPPSVNDIVQIGTITFTNQPTISTNALAKSILLGSAKAVTLTLTTGGSLTVQGNMNGSWTANVTHSLIAGNQTLTVNGDLGLSDGTTGHTINVTVSSGIINVLGSVTQTGGANITCTATGTLNITGSYYYTSGVFNAGLGTVVYNGTGTQSIAGLTYYNLAVNKPGGTSTLTSAVNISGNLSIASGQLDLNATCSVTGNISVSAGATLNGNSYVLSTGGNWNNSGTFLPANSTVVLNGTGTQTVSATTFYNLTVSKSSGTAILSGNAAINGNLSLTAGSFDLLTYTCNRSSAGGTLTVSNNVILYLAGASNFPANYSTYTLGNTSTVNYNGTIAQSVAGITYGNLVLLNGGANVKILAAGTVIDGDITIAGGAGFNAGAFSVQLNGNWINNGTFTAATSTVLFNGTGKTITGNTTFYRIAVAGSYMVSGSNLTFDNTIRILTGGSFNVGSGTATVNGDLTNSGSLTSTGVTTFTGTRVQNIIFYNALVSNSSGVINFNGTVAPVLNSTSTPTYATLNINNTGGVTASVGWNVFVSMNISSGATFNGGASTHTIYGSFTNNGTVTSTGTMSFQPTGAQTIVLTGTSFNSTGTVTFGGTGILTVSGGATAVLNDVVIVNSAGVSATSNWTIGGDFSIGSSAIFNAGTYTYLVAGDIESNGTLNGGTSSFTMSASPGSIEGTNTTTFYDFLITGDITANSDFNISHNYVNNNVFTANPGAVNFTGNTASTLSGSASTYTLAQFAVEKTGGASVLLTKSISGVIEADVNNGILDASTFTITGDASGGLLHIEDNATLRLGGTTTLPSFTTYTFDTISTVEYYGGIQVISSSAIYGNLSLSSAGNKTASAALNVLNNFTLANGTFIAGSYTHNIGGNWKMTSGAFTNTGSTITFNGAGNQDISSTGTFNNLTMNKTTGITTLSTGITVSTSLTFQAGKITTGSNILIMASNTGAVTGAAQNTGWVNGNLRKQIPAGSNIARTFEVGDVNYSPVSVNLATVSTAGTLMVKSTAGDHPLIASSGFAPSNTVNRYWTFTNAGIAFNSASVIYNWIAADVDNGATTANFKVGNYTTGWAQPASSTATATSVTATGLITLGGDYIVGELQQVIVWTGSTSTDWNVTSNWSTAVVPTGTTRVTIPSGVSRFPILSSVTNAVSDLTIASGASLTITNATLRLIGSIANSGTITTTNATIEFAGNIAQTLPANTIAGNSLYNLTVNNPAGVTLGGTLNLTNTLTVSNGSLVTGGFLTLRSTASATARVGAITSAAATPISGTVKVERYIQGRRKYRLMTSSVTTSSAATLVAGQESLSIWGNWQNQANNVTANTGTIITGGTTADGYDQQTNYPSLYTYDAVGRRYVGLSSTNGKNTKFTPLTAGVAYYMFIYGDRVNTIYTNTPNFTVLTATGTLITGDQAYNSSSTIPLSNVTGRYSLLGNPFASPIDWASLPKTNLENTYWGWDPNLNTTGGYVTVSTTGTVTLISPFTGTTGLNQYIQSGQGFFVRTSGASPTLTIREQDKVATNNTNAFRTVNNASLLAVNLWFDNAGTPAVADGALVAFDPAFSNAIAGEDAAKLASGSEEVSIARDNQLLSIDGRKMRYMNDTIFLHIANLTRPNYTLQIFAQNLEGSGLQPFFIDQYLHSSTPLQLHDTNYIPITINLADTASLHNDRFMIALQPLVVQSVSFISFKAVFDHQSIVLNWTVDSESDVVKFVTERSDNGIDFTAQAEILVNNSTDIHAYQWQDNAVKTGHYYYRIRAVHKDGSSTFSTVVKVSRGKDAGSFRVFPNPVRTMEITLELMHIEKGQYTAVLVDMQGKQVMRHRIDFAGGSANVVLPVSKLPAGTYRMQLLNGWTDFSQTILISQ